MNIKGKVGDPAYFDSIYGLVPCTLVAIKGNNAIVDFDDTETLLHWSGPFAERNAWAGLKGEEVPLGQVFPRKALNPDWLRISFYEWEKP
jgi:hypothetical protein